MMRKKVELGVKNRVKRLALRVSLHPADQGFQDGSLLFFVTGRSKSGTTWMGRLLNSHASLFCDTSENSAFHQDFDFRYFASTPRLLHDQAAGFFEDRTWALLKNGLVANLICRCDKISAKRLGDKTPRQDVNRILEVFPRTQIIILLRDFRDVCVSLAFHQRRMTGTWRGIFSSDAMRSLDNEFLRDHLSNYEHHKDFDRYVTLAEQKPQQVLIVRYEHLRSVPTDSLMKVLAFLGVDSSRSVAQRCVDQNAFAKLSGGRVPGEADPDSFFRKGAVGDWRNYFSEDNVRVFKEIAGETLLAAGYEEDWDWTI